MQYDITFLLRIYYDYFSIANSFFFYFIDYSIFHNTLLFFAISVSFSLLFYCISFNCLLPSISVAICSKLIQGLMAYMKQETTQHTTATANLDFIHQYSMSNVSVMYGCLFTTCCIQQTLKILFLLPHTN